MRLLLFISLAIAWSLGPWVSASFDHSQFDAVLKAHVEAGLVNYAALKSDPQLDKYLAQLQKADLDQLQNRDDQVAFWINAYNAYTLKLIISHYPVSSILDIKVPGYESPWKIPLAEVAGKIYTLNQIENEILRVKWLDPRFHYALVCAARSCPQLRNEAYRKDKLNEQLNEQSRWFMIHRNRFDLKTKKAYLSKVYEWYASDFGKNQAERLRTLIPYLEPALANSLKDKAKDWKITFTEWDWQLNNQE
jgi:hypothetical protein